MNYAYDPQATEDVTPTLGAIVSLSDQVDAAVREAENAWQMFCFGPPSEKGMSEATAPVPNDKLHRSRDSLRDSIVRLQQLAEAIRTRA